MAPGPGGGHDGGSEEVVEVCGRGGENVRLVQGHGFRGRGRERVRVGVGVSGFGVSKGEGCVRVLAQHDML